jgi:proteasome lid subunit RPN8/RPN11|tara:strand:+ start:72 stop:473 length:402 start_codon:yes stop_codon:yes gene_type:complete
LQKKILLPKVFRQSLEQHANVQSPLEACAILFGTSNDKTWETTDIFLTENIDKSEVNFTISNKQLMEGYTIAEDKGLDIVGIFHSHPNSQPSPSNTDIKFMKGNPVPWIIYSGVTKEMKAYLLDSDLIQIPIE